MYTNDLKMPLLDIPQGRGAAEPSNYQLRSNEGHLQGEDSASALIIKAMDFLADNAEEQLKYCSKSKPERCAWLRAYLRGQYVDAFYDE